MRKSRAITLTVLTGLTLTGCCLTSLGCGRRGTSTTGPQQYEPPDHTWYDAAGNPIPERWKTDERGNRVLDAEGRPIPEPGVPYDRHHRPWAYSGGVWAPILVPIAPGPSYSRSSSSGSWITGGSGYRSMNSTPAYRSGSGTGTSSVGSSPPAGSSISRGGFGSTGSSSGGSSS